MRRVVINKIVGGILCLLLAGKVAGANAESIAPISLDVHDAGLVDVLRLLATQSGASIIADSSVKSERVTMHLRHVSFDRALAVLVHAYDLRVRRENGVLIVGTSAAINRKFGDVTGAKFTAATVIALRHARSIEAVKQLKGVLPEGAYAADDKQNAILVTGNGEIVATARAFLAALDVPTPQVMFEVKVADITLANDTSNVGIIFGGPGALGTTTYTFANKTIPIQAQLNALISQNRAQILATPRLATLNNKEASLLIGTSYPISSSVSTVGSTSVNVSFVEIGVKLKLTPTIGADGSIVADLHPEFSALQGVTSLGFPIIQNRKIDATLRIQKDETIVLGGLLSDTTAETVTKFPFLGDIPVFGGVFRNRQRTHMKDDIVFLITPHIL